jgi:hypothetical protein
MHLHYPHHGCDDFKKLLSPPRQCATSKKRVFFSIFYTAAVTYPHVITLVYWLILVPHQHNEGTLPFLLKGLAIFHSHTCVVDDVFGHGWFRTFLTINTFVINSLIALIEVLFLSSIRRQEVSRNIFGDSLRLTFLVADLGTRRWTYYSLPHLHRMGIHREFLYWRLCALLLRLQSDRLGARYYRDNFILRPLQHP